MFECAFINTTEETKVFVGQLTWELLNQICMYIYIYIYLVLLFIGLYSLYGMTFYDLDIFLYMCWHNTHVKMVVLSKIFKIRGAYKNVGILLSRRCIFVHWIKHYKSVNKSKANSLGVRRGLLVSARIHFLLGLRSSHVQLSENQFIILDNKYTKWQPATAIK